MALDWITKIVSNWIRERGIEDSGRFYASYKGIVADREDPEVRGRLKLKVPQIYGDDVHDYWALPKGMFSGKDVGFFAIPNNEDIVWVSFEGGDPRFPIWEYGPWRKGDAPSKDVEVEVFQTSSGHRMEFDNKKNKVTIFQKDGQKVVMDNKGIYLGNSDQNLGKFMTAMFDLFLATTVSTAIGPQPFINIADYTKLKLEIEKFLKNAD